MYLIEVLKRRFGRAAPVAPPVSPPAPAPAEVVKFEKPVPQASSGFVPPAAGGVVETVKGFANEAGLGEVLDLAKKAVAVTSVVQTVLDKGLGAGEGRAGLTVLGGAPAAVGVAAAQLTRKGLEALGVENEELLKTAEQAVAAGPLAPAVLIAHGASAVLGAISPEAERAVRDVVKLADPTDPKQPVGAAVQAISGALTSLLGGDDKPKPPPVLASTEQVSQATAILSQQGSTLTSTSLGGLLSVAKQVQPAPVPSPTPPPVSVPTLLASALKTLTPSSSTGTSTPAKTAPKPIIKLGLPILAI